MTGSSRIKLDKTGAKEKRAFPNLSNWAPLKLIFRKWTYWIFCRPLVNLANKSIFVIQLIIASFMLAWDPVFVQNYNQCVTWMSNSINDFVDVMWYVTRPFCPKSASRAVRNPTDWLRGPAASFSVTYSRYTGCLNTGEWLLLSIMCITTRVWNVLHIQQLKISWNWFHRFCLFEFCQLL